MKEFETYTLPNGIRGIHRQVRSGVTHCALVVNSGSRDERPSEYGIAHFTEHALFKGTERRKAYQVNCRLENLGGELNAYTTKEDTTLHATTLRHDFSRAVELISDVIFRSTYPEKELRKEREVIADEINTYKDSPSERIYDDFEDMIFAGSELGHNILGSKASIQRISTAEIKSFVGRTYTTDQMVFSSIGNFSAKSAQAVAERYLSDFQPTKREYQRIAPAVYEAFDKRISRHTHQSHGIIGTRGYGITDERRLPLALLVNILGGPSANSLLNLLLREKYGLSYNVEASYTPYSDSGIVGIYFSSDHANTEQCIELIEEEIARLRGELITPRRLQVAKRQFVAQMAISMESNEGYMLGAGKSFLLYKDIDTLEEAYKKVMAITAEQIMEVAKDSFANLSRLIYK
ncbi:MAG: insulinase family protein [Alistipes sp.]|nr:insulinase family protein [Alistipes sp.]MBR3892000.1 insulinase family protein [Alistipes sp.]